MTASKVLTRTQIAKPFNIELIRILNDMREWIIYLQKQRTVVEYKETPYQRTDNLKQNSC